RGGAARAVRSHRHGGGRRRVVCAAACRTGSACYRKDRRGTHQVSRPERIDGRADSEEEKLTHRLPRRCPMRALVRDYLDLGLSRRGFLKAMAAAGFTMTAAESILKNLAPVAHAE